MASFGIHRLGLIAPPGLSTTEVDPAAGPVEPQLPPVRGFGALPRLSKTPATTFALPDGFTLEDAVACRTYPAVDPASLPDVPAVLVDRIRDARSVLLIGHVRPDADCVGSTLALSRALRSIGKRVDVCVDDDLSAQLHGVDDQGQVRTAADLDGKSWDLAIVMDVMSPELIGGAHGLLADAKDVAVVDHHRGETSREAFGLRPDQDFITWINASYPAAAMMSAALIGRFDAQISSRQYGAIYRPALAGFATDVGFGEHPGIDRTHFGCFKFMLQRAGVSVADVREAITVDTSPRVRALAEGKLVKLPEPYAARLERLHARGDVLTYESFEDDRELPLSILRVPAPYFDLVLDVARLDEPRFHRFDLDIVFKTLRDEHLTDHGGIASVLFEEEDRTTVSLRSAGGEHALQIAERLGGGGHGHSAAARVWGAPIDAVADHILAWAP